MRTEQKKVTKAAAGPLRVACSRCKRGVATKLAKVCPRCGATFHPRCYLAETGVVKGTRAECVCCLSSVLTDSVARTAAKKSRYATDFLRNGFCVIPLCTGVAASRALDERLDAWVDEVQVLFKALIHAHECRVMDGHHMVSLDEGYANFRQRGRGRFEIIHPSISDKVVDLVEGCAPLQNTLQLLLTSAKPLVKKKLMSSGCFFSLPGSETQNYHTDGPALSDAVDLFPYAINVFVPLVDVNQKNGTEFVPKSQMPSHAGQEKSVKPQVATGHALLFDYRVVHRGLGNRTGDSRPCFYATYSRDWYTDRFNFSKKRYRDELVVPEEAMLSRAERLRRRTE